jgi:hypothetical protein
MIHVGAGGMLAAGILPRLAALALATSVVPTTLAGLLVVALDRVDVMEHPGYDRGCSCCE